MDNVNKPIPIADELSAGFWENTAAHRLAFQQCRHCGHYAHPPTRFCRKCCELDSPSFEFVPVSGRGTIVNWTVMRDAVVTGFDREHPWVNVLVEMDEQKDLLFLASLEDGPDAPLKLDAAVEVVFQDVAPNVSVPYFRLAKKEGTAK